MLFDFFVSKWQNFSGYNYERFCQNHITNFTNFSSFSKNSMTPDLLTSILFFAKGSQNYKNFDKVFAITCI